MLSDPEDVEADLVCELDLLEQVAQPLLRADGSPRCRIAAKLRKGVDPDLHNPGSTEVRSTSPRASTVA